MEIVWIFKKSKCNIKRLNFQSENMIVANIYHIMHACSDERGFYI